MNNKHIRLKDTGKVPELRFPEFQNAEKWDVRKLNDLAALITERAGAKSYTLMSITAGLGLVSQFDKFGREIAGNSYKNYYVIRKGDFAYNKSSTKQHPEGQIGILENQNHGAVPNSIFTCFRVNENYVSPSFLKYQFSDNVHGKWLRKFIAVGARANGALNVDSKDLLTLPIVFPTLAEQQKIADCLSSLDDLITTQAQKIETLEAHKKGLMQQLFPAEGETLPRLRFPEFASLPHWEKKRLSELTTYVDYRGKGPNKSGSGIFLVTAKNIKRGYIDYQASKEYVPTDELDEVMRKGKPRIGDVLLTTEAPLGNVAQIDNENIALAQRVIKFRGNHLLENSFLKHYMLSNAFQSVLSRKAIGSAVLGIQGKVLHQLPINIPEKSEQQKIATSLSSLDDLITANNQKLAALKVHKKGLMQGLFPTAEEAAA